MYISSVDCGTTNSRVYILDEFGKVKGKGKYQVGISDVAREKSNTVLKKGLSIAFDQAIKQANIDLKDLKFVLSAGMITSELGLCEVPHLQAPVDINDLAANLVKTNIKDIIDVNIPWYFIPGIKNDFDLNDSYENQMVKFDFMRGEEVQAIGMSDSLKETSPFTLCMLSSHTKFVSVDKSGKIKGSLTTLSGQIYRAFIESTSIGKSVLDDGSQIPFNYFDKEKIDFTYDVTKNSGLLRAMMLPRFLDVLTTSKWYERLLVIDAAIASDDLNCLSQIDNLGFSFNGPIVLIGKKSRCEVYKYLLENKLNWKQDVEIISDSNQIDNFNIQGVYNIAKKATLI
ncbi:MAG: 2-dehydro-3-deoxygalactonokinase [Sphaerochaetaceae bacterium]|nr:2-dehydro-3-deoxygalactonokinase [Sphaerochaetaceae bacterium]